MSLLGQILAAFLGVVPKRVKMSLLASIHPYIHIHTYKHTYIPSFRPSPCNSFQLLTLSGKFCLHSVPGTKNAQNELPLAHFGYILGPTTTKTKGLQQIGVVHFPQNGPPKWTAFWWSIVRSIRCKMDRPFGAKWTVHSVQNGPSILQKWIWSESRM